MGTPTNQTRAALAAHLPGIRLYAAVEVATDTPLGLLLESVQRQCASASRRAARVKEVGRG